MRKQLRSHNPVLPYNKPAHQNREKDNKQALGEGAELLKTLSFIPLKENKTIFSRQIRDIHYFI